MPVLNHYPNYPDAFSARSGAMNRILTITGLAVAVFLSFATFAPILETDQWWIRVWDFPRLQVLVLAALLLVIVILAVVIRRELPFPHVLLGVMTLAIIGFQAYKIVPFSPLWQTEVASADGFDRNHCLSLIVSNVRMDNRLASPLINHLDAYQPDIVLVLENDQWWSDQLAPVAAQYPTVIDHPMSNTYGLLFMTRLSTGDAQLRFITDPEIGSVKARLQLPSGQQLMFYGVHPRPPRAGRDTDQRDHELITIARELGNDQVPAIVSGDLNDVAWSGTTQLFKRTAQALDPRVGRGLYSTFHADHFYLRWPLDHAFHSGQFRLHKLARLSDVGSDHFPLFLALCATDGIPVGNAMPGALNAPRQEQAPQATAE